eukprot:1147280-Pelagomonas_calceolata.AAC.16
MPRPGYWPVGKERGDLADKKAQSLDVRQAIDTALEAAGPLYRAHYAEWGAVHQHSANVMRGIVGACAYSNVVSIQQSTGI